MKNLLFSAASMLLLLSSCSQNELEDNVLPKGQNVVTATIEGQNDSRLSVTPNADNSVFTLNWSSGDSFKVFDEGEGAVYEWISGNDFTASATPANPTYAVYPYTASNAPTISGSTVTMTLNATPSVANINLPMWAVPSVSSEGINYAFKHLAAALQFTLNDIPAGYNQLIVTASNAISGSFVANLSDTEPTLVTTATTLTDDVKTVTVSFTAATGTETKDEVFYIPLPVGTYESLSVSVGSDNSSETKELKSWTNLEVVRGKMYYTTATVDAASVDAVNEALANVGEVATTVNLTEAITTDTSIEIPEAAKNVTLNFAEAPTTTVSAPLVINQNADATSGVTTSQLNVKMPVDATDLYATIDAPTTTVSLNGGSYSKVTATTAANTLIIGEGVTIEELVIEGGNVVLKGNVESISSTVATTVTLENNIESAEIITISGPITLDGANYTLTSSATRAINVNYEGAVTIKNLTIATTADTERAINVIQKAATLTLDDVTAEGFKYAINVASSSVGSNITINGGKYSGYAAMNINGNQTEVTANNAEFYGINDVPKADSNSFAVISIGDYTVSGTTDDVSLTVTGGKLVASSTNGNPQAAVQVCDVTGASVTVDAELTLCEGNVLYTYLFDDSTVKFSDDYAEELEAQGYVVSEAVDGLVTVEVVEEP